MKCILNRMKCILNRMKFILNRMKFILNHIKFIPNRMKCIKKHKKSLVLSKTTIPFFPFSTFSTISGRIFAISYTRSLFLTFLGGMNDFRFSGVVYFIYTVCLCVWTFAQPLSLYVSVHTNVCVCVYVCCNRIFGCLTYPSLAHTIGSHTHYEIEKNTVHPTQTHSFQASGKIRFWQTHTHTTDIPWSELFS